MYLVRIYTKNGQCREIIVKQYEYALERIEHYKNSWPLYAFHTLSHFNGEFWYEV